MAGAEPGAGRRARSSIALSVNTLIVLSAGSLAAFLAARPGWLRVQRYLMGGVLGALAVRLATDRARPAVTG